MRPSRSVTAATVMLASLLLAACGGSDCRDGEVACSADALVLRTCEGGTWRSVACMAERGQLCEAGACVDPWRCGAPAWSRCENDPQATPESLYEKMVYFEDRTRQLHLHPRLRWITPVTLPCREVACAPGETPPCRDCTEPAVPEAEATVADVETFHSGENDGLWSALYLAAEAYRYGATRAPEALEVIRVLLAGEEDRMRITGVPGLFTRQMIPPDVAGLSCPTDLARYVPDEEKDDNQWVRVDADGCVAVVDGQSGGWVASSHCGLEDYAGWCWLDNVSKDEYAGHMFALGALLQLVDDAEVQATVRDLLGQVGRHLVDQRLTLVDWDGRVTEHGRFYALALDDWPSFNAAMALAFIKLAAAATDDPALADWYDGCLLQRGGERDCLERPPESPRPYVDYLGETSLYVGEGSCRSNWNNFSMHLLSLHDLLAFEHDPEVRAAVQRHFTEDFFAPADKARPLAAQHNSLFDFAYAAQKALGPDSDGPAYDAVADGVCMLRQFPASKHARAVTCPPDRCVLASCTDRFDEPMLDYARTVAERCTSTFLWWGSPYDPGDCPEDRRVIYPPTDYLLAYWMGRYYGFIDEDE